MPVVVIGHEHTRKAGVRRLELVTTRIASDREHSTQEKGDDEDGQLHCRYLSVLERVGRDKGSTTGKFGESLNKERKLPLSSRAYVE